MLTIFSAPDIFSIFYISRVETQRLVARWIPDVKKEAVFLTSEERLFGTKDKYRHKRQKIP
ncbi:MAG TPA: hypothetical protein PKH31_11650 [Candidatus Sumerlaeota bacterium]|nr:hypothetical protein [Candidatus Sumerlaeota bacterium]